MWTFDSDTEPGYWVKVESPTSATLRDVTATANGPVAVGDKGIAVGRGRERWGVILEDGPGAKGHTLYAVDTTDDGKRVWFAGSGGALGYYDLVDDERRDYSVPRGNSNTFYALAVAGPRGEEKFLVADGSGHVLPGEAEGTEADWSWSTSVEGGNSVQALTHDEDGYGYAVTNSAVYMTTKDDEWTEIGVEGAQASFYDCSYGDGTFITGGGGGTVYEADMLTDHDDEAVWTPTDIGGFAVYGVDAGRGGQVACGEGGNVHVRTNGGDWERGKYDGTETFQAVMVGEQMVAVGASGLLVERRSADEASDAVKAKFGDADQSGGGAADTGGYAGYEGADGDSGNDPADEPDGPDEGGDTEWEGPAEDARSAGGSGADGTAADESTVETEWEGPAEDARSAEGASSSEPADRAPNSEPADWSRNGSTAGDGATGGGPEGDGATGGSGSTTGDDDWRSVEDDATGDPDGDNFDGRGENYDGDAVAMGEVPQDDPPDEPDGDGGAATGDDRVDDQGNDLPDPSDEDSDEADPADEDTDDDSDSPDDVNDSDADSSDRY